MTTIGRLAAFSSATLGTAAAASIAWVGMTGGPQTVSGKPGDTPATATTVVCVAVDSVLRAFDAVAGCPAGQTALALTPAETNSSNSPNTLDLTDDWGHKDPAAAAASAGQANPLADLERRIENLQNPPLFTVVDTHDNPLLAVMSDRVVLFNSTKAAVGGLFASDQGGTLKLQAADGALAASVGASAFTAGLRISDSGVARLELSRSESGRYSLRIISPGTSGFPLAGIGESRAGTGALTIADLTGHSRALMTVEDGKGLFGVYNATATGVLSLTEGATAGGLLAIGDAASEPMVKMGVNQNRYGVVLAGPRAGFPYVPASGLPGSYFLGCAGGDACRPY